MNTQKRSKPERLTSLLLALIMLLGVLPLPASAVDSFNENPSWMTISGANDSTRMAQLTGMLSQSGTKYIKLGDDIKLNVDIGAAFPINGVKHLDLNGHRINYSDGTDAQARALFEVKSGAEVYIYDSSAKQTGYIHFDGRLTESNEYIYRHLFVVDSGAKLVVNGGELEAGRSKQIYVYNYLAYAGYVRQQVAGTAIYVSKGAECVINGGTIRGRGAAGRVAQVNVNQRKLYINNAAINNAGTLIVNDGFIKGMGGANVIKEITEENFIECTPTTVVYSGILDTHKVDRHYVDDANKTWQWGHYGNSTTGIDVAHRTVDYDAGMRDETDDSRRTWNIYGTSSKTAGEFFKIQSKTAVGGVTSALPSSWNPTKNYWIGVDIGTQSAVGEYNPYYTYDAVKALAQDYNSKTGYQSMLTWAVYDSSGKQVSAEINKVPDMTDNYNHLSKMSSANLRVNMKDFTAPSGGAISWKTGQRYTLRCTITESWQGQNAWNITSFDEWNFAITDWDTVTPTLTAVQASTSTGNTADITATASSNGDLSKLYDQIWYYGYYGNMNGTYQPIWQTQNRGDSVYTYTSLPNGPQRLCLMIYGQTIDGLYQSLNATADVLVMPRIEAKQQYGGTYGSWGSYEIRTNDTFTVSNNAMVRLRAIDTNILKDPVSGNALVVNGVTVNGSSIKWQWWNSTTQKWENINRTGEETGSTNVTGVYLTEDTDGSRCILETNRTGTYRAYISCYGKTWYSAAPFKVVSKDYTSAGAYKVSASVTNTTTEYGDGNKIKFTVNSNDAAWGTWSAGLIVKKDGVPDSSWKYFTDTAGATEYQTSYFSRNNTVGVSKEVNLYAPSTVNAFFQMNSAKNIIPGKYTFIPVAQAENGTVVKGEPFTIYVEKKATGVDILADCLNVTNGEGEEMLDAPTYILPTNTKTVTFRTQKIQANATQPGSATVRWSSSNTYVATIDRQTGVFTALKPGTTCITLQYTFEQGDSMVEYTRYLNVVVPIAEFKFGNVDWAAAARNGTKYQDLAMPITQVRSYQGDWINNNNTYMEAKCTQVAYLANGQGFGTNETVEYNQSVRVRFKAVAKEGYQFFLKPSGTGSYVADTGNIKTHAVGGTAMDTALKLGYNFSSSYGGEYDSGIYGYDSPSLCGIIIPMDQTCIKNPNARYVDVVSVTTAEPREGDSRYQGDPESYLAPGGNANMMDAKVMTLMYDGDPIEVYQSTVSKVSSVQGVGIAYDPISYADYIGNMSEAYGVLGTTQKPVNASALTAPRYEAATYFHNLILDANGTDSEGKTVYFAPDVKMFINGHPVELILNGYNGTVNSGYSAQRLEVRYYYVSDASPAFTGGTVSGLTAPATGTTPVSADDLTISAVRADNTTSSDALYVSRLTWYVDANGNGKPDDGEDTDVLAANGTFKGNTVYSAYMELAANENTGRIDNLSFALKLNTGAANPVILNSTAANGSYTFAKTNPPPGVTVSGTVTSFGSQTDDVTVQLIKSGESEAAYEAVVQGNSIGYFIENVAPGSYTMKVMKQNHVTREYAVTVGTENVQQDVKIHLKGDINGDGKITMVDSAKANSHARGVALLTGYELKCADVVANDGNVTMADAGRINAHAKGMSKLW